ncbi:MAG: SIS domain-containing protein [Patescibacteria group bacterium]
MLAEIESQPGILAALQREAADEVGSLAALIEKRRIGLVVLAARGTSDHAAIFGKYFLEYVTGLPVALAAPSIVTLYGRPLRLANALVIGLSQSGEAADVDEYLRAARAGGALTAVITNDPGSTMARGAEHLLLCRAGVERAVAATKTYTAEMALLAMLGLALAHDAGMRAEFDGLPGRLAEVLALEAEIRLRVQRYAFMRECVVLARGFNQATALETALKIQETSHIGAKGYSAADFLHGPIAVLHPRYPALVFAPSGAVLDGLLEIAGRVKEHGGELVVFSDAPRALAFGQTSFALPAVAEWMSPFTAIVAAQLFACFLAEAKGYDPDRPAGLAKVTVTR